MSSIHPPMSTSAGEPPRRPWWLARRVIVAALGIAALSGGATALLGMNELNKVVAALRQNKAVDLRNGTLAPTHQGEAETLLLVGNDERPPPKSNPFGAVEPHYNEMLLVRIDPSRPTISMLSIPRELRVTFTTPNGQVITNRINSAYTYGYEEGHGTAGGAQLMLDTIKHLTGLSVNHVFVTNFPKFRKAVDELGCVYMMVDRRYYHVNEPGGEQYFEINLQPGYQRLCGRQALEFVANRHEDTSLMRDARDQRFLLAVKSQYGPSALEEREKLERIFGKAVQTDSSLHSSNAVLQLLELLAESAGKPVRQVPFHVNLLPTYDAASEQEISEAVHTFLNGTAAISPGHISTGASSSGSSSPSHGHQGHQASVTTGMVATPTTTIQQDQAISPDLPFPVLAPRYQFSTAAAAPDLVHRYDIRAPNQRLYPSYVIVIDRGGLGEFYDVEGTTWTNPPVLANATSQLHLSKRTYGLYYNGEHLRTIAWREDGAAYWIENTLSNAISPRDLVALARETVPVVNGSGIGYQDARTATSGFTIPARSSASSAGFEDAGTVVAVAALLAIAGLAVLLIGRQRELRELREQVGAALASEARLRSALVDSPASSSGPSPER